MATYLQPKTSYKLVSQDHFNQDKVIVQVKLTDSCLRALQDFKNAKGPSKNTPLIKFSGQNGTITIPSTEKDPESNRRQFTFSCSTLQSTNSQSCLDCIQQPGRSKAVMSLGSITHKINVNATDDSYKMTQDKMKVVEKERKEVSTRVINMPKKAKTTRNTTRQVLKTPVSVKRKIQSIPKLSNNPKPSSIGPSKSLRERVIHLLAVKPFKKIELITRLKKDGVTLKDKNALTNILKQVTSVNNNQYTLLKKVHPEIKVDTWPYSEIERKIVQSSLNAKPDKEQSLQKSESNEVKTKESNKRQSESTEYGNPALKKQRISHVVSNNNVAKHAQDTDKPISLSKQNSSRNKPLEQKSEQQNKDASSSVKLLLMSENDSEECQTDYKKKYRPITNNEQRCSYKRDFQVEYHEYQRLQNQISSVAKKFKELKENLKKCPEQSEEREIIEKQVLELYQKQLQDPTWESDKKRVKDLHCKLTYIKGLIREYDDKRVDTAAT
ncbi:RNA polymerase II elongation factor ELL2-like [Actinia tenebrosa]|uniref:RNA polymerase II elongation factor ELL2-like n=1 Tax=Actinia tenebrosa TaxID=6105 RepID=A0A6P8IB90_ACTTE|nr:RNA polymerase II elongation factor ELL2-like [Actinia tenebrosa]